MDEKPVPTPPTQPVQPPQETVQGEAIDGVGSGSLFKTEAKTEVEDNKPFKLDTGQYAKQALIVLIILSLLLVGAAILFFREDIDSAASISISSITR